ncbi:MAG TPA: lysylphosphatidylglycerol synthase transmembrane domain-containing protein [Gemmatimonadaceae bacterium]|nr:lysylphosphatidylglycerol synthase transmembrane domain-containing protein [Gemmatimonadaceae bacterium]
MKLWLRIAVSGGLLLLLLLFLPWDTARAAIGRLPFSLWMGALAGFIAGHFLGVLKWRVLVNVDGGRPLRMLDAVRCYSAGLFANLCLPSIVGGDVLRAALAARVTRSPEAAVLAGVVDRIIDVATLGLLIAVGGVFARDAIPAWGRGALTISLLVVALIVVVFLPLLVRRPLEQWPRRFRRRIGRGLVALRSVARNPGSAFISLTLSVIIQSSFVLLNVAIGRAIGINVSLAVWFVVWPLAKVAGLLPISLGGLAVRDAAFAALLVPLRVPVALGILASLVWQSVLIAGGLLAGAVWWIIARCDTAESRSTVNAVSPVAPG